MQFDMSLYCMNLDNPTVFIFNLFSSTESAFGKFNVDYLMCITFNTTKYNCKRRNGVCMMPKLIFCSVQASLSSVMVRCGRKVYLQFIDRDCRYLVIGDFWWKFCVFTLNLMMMKVKKHGLILNVLSYCIVNIIFEL